MVLAGVRDLADPTLHRWAILCCEARHVWQHPVAASGSTCARSLVPVPERTLSNRAWICPYVMPLQGITCLMMSVSLQRRGG